MATAASAGCPFSWRSARNEYKVVPSDGFLSLCIVRVCLVCVHTLRSYSFVVGYSKSLYIVPGEISCSLVLSEDVMLHFKSRATQQIARCGCRCLKVNPGMKHHQLCFIISDMHLGGRQWSLYWHFIFSSVYSML
jgi:hypothetical protein